MTDSNTDSQMIDNGMEGVYAQITGKKIKLFFVN